MPNPETRYLLMLSPDQAEELEDFLSLEEREAKARSEGELAWADLLLSQLQQIERDFTPEQREALGLSHQNGRRP